MQLMSCLAQNDDTGLLEIESELTIATAMESTSVQKLGRLVEKRNVVKAITYLTMRLADSFNMKGKFNNKQAAMLALDLYEVFGYETLEDVVLMYKLVRQGRIGDGKDFKLDGQTVMHKWVPAYLELKAIEREKQHQKRKDTSKGSGQLHPSILKEAGKQLRVSKTNGLGARKKEELSTPKKYSSPIQKREVYLKLLEETAAKTPTDSLQKNLQQLIDDNGKMDEVGVLKRELYRRKNYSGKAV